MGSLTLLFRQPVAALQVLAKDGTWKWVRPQTDALTVNIADALQFLTSKSIHYNTTQYIPNANSASLEQTDI